jgi:acetoin utilization deacetylase AcuC-like enzyme
MTGRYLHAGLVADPVCKIHDPGWGHPEMPSRYDAAFRALCSSNVIDQVEKIPCRIALDREVLRGHEEAYLELVKAEAGAGAASLSTGDTDLCERSLEAALYTVGGVLNAVDAVVKGRIKNAFCLVRPPGHHATLNRGMGFCLFNNVALAARHAQELHGIGRVLIVDWDVHHGNGTQDIFYADDSVFYFSIHQWPWYPGTGAREETGAGRGLGCTLNCPLPAGTGREPVLAAFENELMPAMDKFRPELVLISAGFDSRIGDPLGSFLLEDDDFSDMTRRVLDIARAHAGGRLVSVLEGGYNLAGLATAVSTHVNTLLDA